MSQQVIRQVKQAIMAQLYQNILFSLPRIACLALCWSLLFYQYVPLESSLSWLTGMVVVLFARYRHARWRSALLQHTPLSVLERELLIGITITSLIWALGLNLYMGKLPDIYRAVMIIISSHLLVASAITLFGCRRLLYGAMAPISTAMLFELYDGNPQEQIVALLIGGYLLFFLPSLLQRLRKDQFSTLHQRFSHAQMASELELLSNHLRLTSRQDGLTGIANRPHFDERLSQAWRRCLRANTPVSLVFIDVDYFKQFNDFYGHQAGDECLQQVAGLIADAQCREDDLAARYGGEEFVLLLPSTSSQGAQLLAERVNCALAKLQIVHQHSLVSEYVTCSFGVATVVPDRNMSEVYLIQKADAALYQAKHNGRNRIEVA